MEEFDAKLDKYQNYLNVTNARLDKIEHCCDEILAQLVDAGPESIITSPIPIPHYKCYKCLQGVQGKTDEEVFSQFCKDH